MEAPARDATTYPVSSFINFKLSAADAAAANAAMKAMGGKANVAAGDFSVLVGMQWPDARSLAGRGKHSGGHRRRMIRIYRVLPKSREASSGAIAGVRLAITPWRSPTAWWRSGNRTSVARTSESQFTLTIRGSRLALVPRIYPIQSPACGREKKVTNNFGVQTNCMSCHAAANYTSAKVPTAPDYSGDRYVDLGRPAFQEDVESGFPLVDSR